MTRIDSTVPNSRIAITSSAVKAEEQPASDTDGALLLPAPTSKPGDIGQAIATLMIDTSFAQRKTAREAKVKAESAMMEAQKHQIEQMHAEADAKYTAAQVDAWVQIGTGAATLGGMGLVAAGGGLESSGLKTVGTTLTKAMKDGGTDLAKGLGGLVSSGQRYSADTSGAAAKEAEHAAGRMKAAVEDCAEDVRATKESVRKALDFLKEYQSALAQTQAAALHRA